MCGPVQRGASHWNAHLLDAAGARIEVQARCLVNAAGPWAETLLKLVLPGPRPHELRLIKGSHIVVPKLFDHPYAYIFQHPDGRIVFALPYEREFTLIGTTDVDFTGDPGQVAISEQERDYLCTLASGYFRRPVVPADVVWSYAGVRPLVEDAAGNAAAATRDFRLEHDTAGAPLLCVFGGKITTARKLAEQALDSIAPALGCAGRPWTHAAVLPGGDLFGPAPSDRAVLEYDAWARTLQQRYGWLSTALLARYARAYGTRVHRLLEHCRSTADMGPEIVPGLYAAEVYYLATQEWALSAADILWRRTKLGLHTPAGSEALLDAWLADSRARAHGG
jgi:glycerol-3-phosphate dehydrogenase